jgi:predicted MFS family arabinose efflux permease
LEPVHGGFSIALLTMALSSPVVGRTIDRHGGRQVMATGAGLNALGCVGLALSHSVAAYYTAWICLGIAMRLTLYDAAFATLARIEGPHAGRSMSQITLLGGLASTVFWPVGQLLAASFGWRGALIVYAGFALLTVPLHLSLPDGRYEPREDGDRAVSPGASADGRPRVARWLIGGLFAMIIALVNVLNSGMSAHMIDILAGLGVATSAAVWISSLRGVGQSLARLCEIVFGRRLDPLKLNLGATFVLPCCFAIGLMSGQSLLAASAFAFLYGAGNGIATITRGTIPIVLFDHRDYGTFTGRLLAPSFVLSAFAPLVFAFVIDRGGADAALYLSLVIGAGALIASAVLERVATSGPSPLDSPESSAR